jgi:putative regulator of septum formation
VSRRLRALALPVVAAVMLTACSTADSSAPQADPTPVLRSPSPTPTHTIPPKPPPPPGPHTCYRIAYDDALAPTNQAKPVPCNGQHTAITFFVGHFPPELAVDGDPVHKIEATACPHRFASFVGGTLEERRLSLLRTVWFTPTVDDATLGSHWFQCVAIALQGDQELAPLAGPVQGALDRTESRDRYALCGTAEPGTAGFEQRMCALSHSWRALRTVPFPAGRYPGVDTVRGAGQTPCRDAGRAVASDPLNYRWSYQWPTLQQWQSGQTWGTCWAPS